MSTLVPGVMVALTAAATTALPTVNVSLGYTGAADPGDYLWIGVENPFAASLTPAASASQEWAGSQRQTGRNESGDVLCCIEVWNGEGDVAAALARCGVILGTVETLLRTTDNLGVVGLLHIAATGADWDLAWSPSDAVARCVFRTHFEGRI